jgi:hypothetical protein
MLSNSQRIELVRRMEVITQEMNDIAHILNTNPVPVTDDDIDRGVRSLLKQEATLVLSSLSRQLEDGIDNTVLATYHPRQSGDKCLKAYARETTKEALMVFKRMLELGNYRYATKEDEGSEAFCVQLQFSETTPDVRLEMVRVEPSQPIAQIGPNRRVRQLMSEETLRQHLDYTKVNRADVEQAVIEQQRQMSEDDVVWFHVDVTNQKAADKATG